MLTFANRYREDPRHVVKPMVFLDFDGTITCRDATDAILEAYADPQWLHIEEQWKKGRISSRDCLQSQMTLVTATKEEVDSLLNDVDIDRGFVSLLDNCSAHRVPVCILSDGFDYCIQRIFSRPSLSLAPHLKGVQVVSSHLEPTGEHWRVGFDQPCPHGCGTCKPGTMERLNTADGLMIFVGDGLSDIYAAARADLVFAKNELAAYCDEQAISYTPYDNLATIARRLDDLFQSNTASERATPAL